MSGEFEGAGNLRQAGAEVAPARIHSMAVSGRPEAPPLAFLRSHRAPESRSHPGMHAGRVSLNTTRSARAFSHSTYEWGIAESYPARDRRHGRCATRGANPNPGRKAAPRSLLCRLPSGRRKPLNYASAEAKIKTNVSDLCSIVRSVAAPHTVHGREGHGKERPCVSLLVC